MVDEQPLRKRWVPGSEAALVQAFEQGLLAERNWCELKREIGTTRSANKELARDLASFAIDGGTVCIGLDEDAPEGNPLHPVLLDRLAERVEQVAGMGVHPPLMIDCTTIPSVENPERGYLIVHIPASPLAPHQVDGAYQGRGDKTKRRLTDPEVERLFQRRKSWEQDAFAELDELMTLRDANKERSFPQLFFAARPVAAWSEMLRPLAGDEQWQVNMEQLRVDVCNDAAARTDLARVLTQGWDSNFTDLRYRAKSAGGSLLRSTHPHVADENREWLTMLDVHESGTIWFSRGLIGSLDRDFNGTHYTAIYMDVAVVAVMEALTAVTQVAHRVGYISSWDLALGITNLRSSRAELSWVPPVRLGYEMPPQYERAEYRKSTRADQLELDQDRVAVLERLVGLYLRGAGQADYLGPMATSMDPRRAC